MSIPNVENHVMTLSEEKGNTHTYTHGYTLGFFYSCYTFICPSTDSRPLGSPAREVCICVCMSQCVFILSFKPTCQAKPGSSVKVKTRRSSFRDRQEKQKTGRVFCQGFFLCFVSILTNAIADLNFSCFSKQPSSALKL